MSKYFYIHLIEFQSVFLELDNMELSDTERKHLAILIDSTLHHHILDAILSQLNNEDKKIFMQYLTKGKKEEIWEFLNSKVERIDEKIKQAANELKEKLHKDIKEAKRVTKHEAR